jgi:hypothetical protein
VREFLHEGTRGGRRVNHLPPAANKGQNMTTETLSKLAADSGADLPEKLPPREVVEIAITAHGLDLRLANGEILKAAMIADLPAHLRSRSLLPLTGDAIANWLIPEVRRSGRLPPIGPMQSTLALLKKLFASRDDHQRRLEALEKRIADLEADATQAKINQ